MSRNAHVYDPQDGDEDISSESWDGDFEDFFVHD
jgi:hypothetical protein